MSADRTPVDFGSRLREARERRGITLRQIANATKISVGVLDALERNDISRLPGGIFGRAFVRSYAVEVGLDPEATIRDFMAHLVGGHLGEERRRGAHSTPSTVSDQPTRGRRRPIPKPALPIESRHRRAFTASDFYL